MAAGTGGMLTRIGNFVLFQIGWFACVLSAAADQQWIGLLIGLTVLLVHGWHAADHGATIRFVLTIGLFGVVIDSALGCVGVLVFRDGLIAAWLCPPWLAMLWLIFSTTLRSSLAWLVDRTASAALLGSIFGPLSYYGGHALGALQLGGQHTTSLLVLGIVWALLLPCFVQLGHRCDLAPQ